MNKLLLTLLLSAASIAAFAQDKIYTRLQKAPIECEVTEVGVNEIKYKPVGHPLPVVTVDKQDVIKIVYQSGEVMMINNPLKDFTMYAGQHKWNLKLDLLSPLLGYTGLFLEHAQKPGRSVEYNLNIIGLGKNQTMLQSYGSASAIYMNAVGGGAGIGVKFMRLPDYINGQIRLRHILQGSYIKPAINFSLYSRDFYVDGGNNVNTITKTKTCYAINPNVTLGRQWIFDNVVSFELYFAIGFSADNVRSNQEKVIKDYGGTSYDDLTPFNSFGYTRFSSGDFGLSLISGLRVGYLFDFKKNGKGGKN